jgi:hypothetical protein
MIPTENMPPVMERVLASMLGLSRHGHPASAAWILRDWVQVLLQGYLRKPEHGLGLQELVDLVESDGNQFEGKAHLMRELRLLDARVASALNEGGPDAWGKANLALGPYVEHWVVLVRRLLPCLFDFSVASVWRQDCEG